MPKIILVILENDLIGEEPSQDPLTAPEFYEEYIEYLIKQITKMVKKLENLLPEQAKRSHWPRIAFIHPTAHRNYEENEAKLRQKFSSTLEECVASKEGVWALRLLQVWDKNNTNFVRADTHQITGDGINAYWRAVDRTIRFCDKKIQKEEYNADLNPFRRNAERTVQNPAYANRVWINNNKPNFTPRTK